MAQSFCISSLPRLESRPDHASADLPADPGWERNVVAPDPPTQTRRPPSLTTITHPSRTPVVPAQCGNRFAKCQSNMKRQSNTEERCQMSGIQAQDWPVGGPAARTDAEIAHDHAARAAGSTSRLGRVRVRKTQISGKLARRASHLNRPECKRPPRPARRRCSGCLAGTTTRGRQAQAVVA